MTIVEKSFGCSCLQWIISTHWYSLYLVKTCLFVITNNILCKYDTPLSTLFNLWHNYMVMIYLHLVICTTLISLSIIEQKIFFQYLMVFYSITTIQLQYITSFLSTLIIETQLKYENELFFFTVCLLLNISYK